MTVIFYHSEITTLTIWPLGSFPFLSSLCNICSYIYAHTVIKNIRAYYVQTPFVFCFSILKSVDQHLFSFLSFNIQCGLFSVLTSVPQFFQISFIPFTTVAPSPSHPHNLSSILQSEAFFYNTVLGTPLPYFKAFGSCLCLPDKSKFLLVSYTIFTSLLRPLLFTTSCPLLPYILCCCSISQSVAHRPFALESQTF